MTISVILRPQFERWFAALTDAERKTVRVVLEVLQEEGIRIGFPFASHIIGATLNLWELRPAQGSSPLRVFYSFDEMRQAVVLLGGSKAGVSSDRFYRRAIQQCEGIWKEHQKDLEDRPKIKAKRRAKEKGRKKRK